MVVEVTTIQFWANKGNTDHVLIRKKILESGNEIYVFVFSLLYMTIIELFLWCIEPRYLIRYIQHSLNFYWTNDAHIILSGVRLEILIIITTMSIRIH